MLHYICEKEEGYPLVRTIVTKDAYETIKKSGYIYSRKELAKHTDELSADVRKNKGVDDADDTWWKDREKSDAKMFGTQDLIFCTADWFNDSGHETGHGSVMIYFKPSIFTSFKVTMTATDSYGSEQTVYGNEDIKKIYGFIKNIKTVSDDPLYSVAKKIADNMEHKNENGFYDEYAEFHIHASKVPTSYISEIRTTTNYLHEANITDLPKLLSKEKFPMFWEMYKKNNGKYPFPNSEFKLYYDGNVITAYVVWYWDRQPELFGKGVLHLDTVEINKDYRGKGLFKPIMDEMMKKSNKITLQAHEDSLIELYKRWGFELYGDKKQNGNLMTNFKGKKEAIKEYHPDYRTR